MKKKIVITRMLPPEIHKRIESLIKENLYEIIYWNKASPIPRDKFLEEINGSDGILCSLTEQIDSEVFNKAGTNLKIVSTMSVGYEHIDVPFLKKNNIKIGYTPNVLTDAVADLTLSLALLTTRRISEAITAVKIGEWRSWEPCWMLGTEIRGKTIGIFGFGRIGMAVAQRFQGFNVGKIIYTNRKPNGDISKKFCRVDIEELCRESDIIIVTSSLNEGTKYLFNYELFKKMKPSAFIINSSRSDLVNQDDLIRALEEKLIAGAGLDVTNPEPIPTSHPFLQMKNVVVLPHIGSATIETRTRMGNLALDNLLLGLNNSELLAEL